MDGAKPIFFLFLLHLTISTKQVWAQCQHDQLYPVNGDCTRFQRCDEGFLRHPESCGQGTGFDPQQQICVHISQINTPECVQALQNQLGPFSQYSQLCQTPPPGVDISQAWNVAHPDYCNGFITCGNGVAIPACHICGQGLIFYQNDFRTCREGKQKNCEGNRVLVSYNDIGLSCPSEATQEEGDMAGTLEGTLEGDTEGTLEGDMAGILGGTQEGAPEGDMEGTEEGAPEGALEGDMEGTEEGALEGDMEGTEEGAPEGALEGDTEGTEEGALEGDMEGTEEGVLEGDMEGTEEGALEGDMEGTEEGAPDGALEGDTEGTEEGALEGDMEGTEEGALEGDMEGTEEGVLEGDMEGTEEGAPEGTEEAKPVAPAGKINRPLPGVGEEGLGLGLLPGKEEEVQEEQEGEEEEGVLPPGRTREAPDPLGDTQTKEEAEEVLHGKVLGGTGPLEELEDLQSTIEEEEEGDHPGKRLAVREEVEEGVHPLGKRLVGREEEEEEDLDGKGDVGVQEDRPLGILDAVAPILIIATVSSGVRRELPSSPVKSAPRALFSRKTPTKYAEPALPKATRTTAEGDNS
ncbi:hypothetical protein ACOMHN_001610 [Nucella lapillus]